MSKFHYARLVTPQRLSLGKDGDDDIFVSCAQCGKPSAVIHGQIKSEDGHVAIIKLGNGITFRQCCFCEECFERLLAGERVGNEEHATSQPMACQDA